MDEFLKTLADKLGTTTEYLWNALLRQAPISATTDIIQTLILAVATYGLYRIHCRFKKNNEYDDFEAWPAVPMIFAAGIFTLLWVVVLVSGVPNIINGYFNPEYWALHEIMSNLQ